MSQCQDIKTGVIAAFDCFRAPCPCPDGTIDISALSEQKQTRPQFNPATPPPQSIDIANCRRHQAPPNFTYIWNGYGCVLVPLINGLPATTAGSTTQTPAAGNLGANLSNAIQAHPIALLALAGVAIYAFAGKGMKPKSREVVSTTRY